MAGAVQEINGEWKIVKLKHDNNAPKDLAIPAKFTYKGKNEVSVEITGEEQTVEDTGWITELGTPIHLKDIAAKFTDVPVNDGGVWKIYRGVSAFTEQSDIIYPTGITIDNLLWNKNIPATGGTATESNCTYKVNLHYNNDTTKDITDKAQVSGQESVPATQKPRAHEAGTLQLTATYGKFTSEASVKIWQNGVGVIVTSITLDNLTWTRDIPAAGGTATTSNCSYTVTAHYNDRSTGDVTNDATVTGSKEVDASTLPERHDAGTLTLRADYEGKIATASTIIYQAAASNYLTATCDDDTAPSEQIVTTLRINSNVSWTASSEDFWIKIKNPTGTGTGTREVTIEVNISIVQRNGKITVTGNGVSPVEIDITQDPGDIPVTFNITSPGKIIWARNPLQQEVDDREIRYSKDDGVTWTTISTRNTGATVNVSAGDKLLFVGDNPGFNGCTFSGSTAGFNLEGNIISLIKSTDFTTARTLSTDYTFSYLFCDCNGLTSAEKLILPATGLTKYCYYYMFARCASLTKPPVLKATAMKTQCYARMFLLCTNLLETPQLPATTLAEDCYFGMFEKCRSLTGVSSLPAMTMEKGCYSYMFMDCNSLTTAPELPATTLAQGCYQHMFDNCTSLTSAPELPATTLVTYCYKGMFDNCQSLNYIKCLATDISAEECTKEWVFGVPRTGTFVRNENMNDWEIYSYDGIPARWDIEPPITPPGPVPPAEITWKLKNLSSSYGLYGEWAASNAGDVSGDLDAEVTRDQTTPVPFNLISFHGAVTGAEDLKTVTFRNTRSGASETMTGQTEAGAIRYNWIGSMEVKKDDTIEVSIN